MRINLDWNAVMRFSFSRFVIVSPKKLIELAHPDFRDSLIVEAHKMKIWTKPNKIS